MLSNITFTDSGGRRRALSACFATTSNSTIILFAHILWSTNNLDTAGAFFMNQQRNKLMRDCVQHSLRKAYRTTTNKMDGDSCGCRRDAPASFCGPQVGMTKNRHDAGCVRHTTLPFVPEVLKLWTILQCP